MRGREQHVERKIRLWVVQQEHNRLREGAAPRLGVPATERTEAQPSQVDLRSLER